MSKVSVVVPVYNGAAFIRETLECILASQGADFDVVVLDNASSDSTAAVLDTFTDPRIRRERNDHVLPLPENWQKATSLATGDYIKVVCADDLIRPDALRRQAAVLDADPSVALVVSRRHIIDDNGLVLSYGSGLPGLIGRHTAQAVASRVTRLGINPLGESAGVMFRRADFERVGGWDGSLTYPMDVDLWLRLLTCGDLMGQRAPLAAFRISRDSLTSLHNEHQLDEHLQFVSHVAERSPRRRGERLVGRLTSKLAWGAWSLRRRIWQSRLIGAPRPLGAPAPLLRRLLP